jgi:drug/metabolite transporter (DMT)-like permease
MILLATIVAIIPIFLIKKYLDNKQNIFLFLAMLCYYILMQSYIHIFSENEISKSYVLLQILQIFIVVISSIIIFNETITLNKIIGIILGSIAIYLLSS